MEMPKVIKESRIHRNVKRYEKKMLRKKIQTKTKDPTFQLNKSEQIVQKIKLQHKS